MKKNVLVITGAVCGIAIVLSIIFIIQGSREQESGEQKQITKQEQVNESVTNTNNKGADTVSDPNYIIKTVNKNITVSSEDWKYVSSSDDSKYSKNYSAIVKKDGEVYEQIVTVFLNKMTEDRKIGEKISDIEYIEIFALQPNTVTVQIRVNKGDYWVMSRQSFEMGKSYSVKANTSYADLIANIEGMQNKIDNTRYLLNNSF